MFVAVLVVTVGWLAVCFNAFNRPQLDRVTRADAIIVLGEPDAPALARTHRLLDAGVSTQLVLSVPFGRPPECDHSPPRIHTYCFVPAPSDTRGEAEEIGRLASARRWHTIVVVTWKSHISRSRLLIKRCYSGRLEMTSYPPGMSVVDFLAEYVHQSAGYGKALLHPDC